MSYYNLDKETGEEKVTNTIFCFLGSVNHRDFSNLENCAKVDQLEAAMRLDGIFSDHRVGQHQVSQRHFVAAMVRFAQEEEACKVNTRNQSEWTKQGWNRNSIEWLDRMKDQGYISYSLMSKLIRPKDKLKKLIQLDNVEQAIIAA
jgi:hypothetical protein